MRWRRPLGRRIACPRRRRSRRARRPASPTCPPPALPAVYRLRLAPDRATLAQGRGGSPESESAVQAALDWLARNESPDGHWSVRQHEGGRAASADGRDRRHAGIEADSAATGLALLAFLASGQTHRDGLHKDEVRRGLEYLVVRAGRRRKPRRPRRPVRENVFPRHGRLRPERSLRHDRRRSPAGGGPAGRRLHRRRAGPLRRRLAIPARRPRRHQSTRLAIDGAEERGTCRRPHSRCDARGDGPFSAERRLGKPRRAGVVSPRRTDHPLDDRRGPVLLADSRHGPRRSGRQ